MIPNDTQQIAQACAGSRAKKAISLLLVMLMLSLSTGCSDQAVPESAEGLSPTTTEETDQTSLDQETDMMLLRHGAIKYTLTGVRAEDLALVRAIIMDYNLKSAGWPALDIRAIPQCYLLRIKIADGASAEYYVFTNEEKAAVQDGTDGFYSYIDERLFQQLEERFKEDQESDQTSQKASQTMEVSFSELEIDSAKGVIEDYFQALQEKEDEALLRTLTPWHDAANVVLYGEEKRILLAIEGQPDEAMAQWYISQGRGQLNGTSLQNVMVLKVDFDVQCPVGASSAFHSGEYVNWAMILIREHQNAPWLIDDQGY